MMLSEKPIGIFDSGIGGLTVAHAIKEKLPNERLIYFGDTAHLPYGEKSEAAIQAFAIKIADILLKKGCKVIVIACNSASSAAYELLKEYVATKARVINVIDPMVQMVCEKYADQEVGLIGTRRTVASNIYTSKIEACNQKVKLRSIPTPLLVPMIEEGFYNNKISMEIIDKYLSDENLQNIKALILGCTHYPLIRKQLETYYKNTVDLLDSAEVLATYLSDYLHEAGLKSKNISPKHEFLVSDFTVSFEASAKIFFKEKLRLIKYPLWN